MSTFNDGDRLILEDCKATWRAEAHAQALQDLKAEGLDVGSIERYAELYAEHYRVWERLGLEGIE